MDSSRIFDRFLIDCLRIFFRIFDVFLIDFYVIDAQAITRRHCKAQQDTVAVRLYGAAMSDCIPNVAVATLLRPLAMLQLTAYLRKRVGGYAALLRFGYTRHKHINFFEISTFMQDFHVGTMKIELSDAISSRMHWSNRNFVISA